MEAPSRAGSIPPPQALPNAPGRNTCGLWMAWCAFGGARARVHRGGCPGAAAELLCGKAPAGPQDSLAPALCRFPAGTWLFSARSVRPPSPTALLPSVPDPRLRDSLRGRGAACQAVASRPPGSRAGGGERGGGAARRRRGQSGRGKGPSRKGRASLAAGAGSSLGRSIVTCGSGGGCAPPRVVLPPRGPGLPGCTGPRRGGGARSSEGAPVAGECEPSG